MVWLEPVDQLDNWTCCTLNQKDNTIVSKTVVQKFWSKTLIWIMESQTSRAPVERNDADNELLIKQLKSFSKVISLDAFEWLRILNI